MKIDDGYIKIHFDDLLNAPGVLEECGKHASFRKNLFEGITQLMLTDEVQWAPDESPWWVTVSFGRSDFEEARMKILSRLDEAAQTQLKKFRDERDTFSKYYDEYQTKCIQRENTIHELRNQIRILKSEARGEGE